MTQQRKQEIAKILKSYDLIGTPALKSLWEYTMLQFWNEGSTPEDKRHMLMDISGEVKRLRRELETAKAGIRYWQKRCDELAQLELFGEKQRL